MELNVTQKREISQLYETVRLYFGLAEEIKSDINSHISLKISDISKFYETGSSVNKEIKSINTFIAHLSSSAIRICTIYEVYGETNYRKKYKNEKNKNTIINEIENNLPEFIPFLLRDNIAHQENNKNILWELRQDILNKLIVEDIYSSMKKAIANLNNFLQSKSSKDI